MTSKARTVEQYLASLPQDRRAAISAVREVILKNLDEDYEEGIIYGMIGYYVPHRIYPAGYHCDPTKPLGFVCLGSQKNYISLHMMSVYGDHDHARWFRDAWKKTGEKLDMGAACIRIKKVEDAALDVIGESIKKMPAKKYIAFMETALESRAKGRSTKPKPKSKKRVASR